ARTRVNVPARPASVVINSNASVHGDFGGGETGYDGVALGCSSEIDAAVGAADNRLVQVRGDKVVPPTDGAIDDSPFRSRESVRCLTSIDPNDGGQRPVFQDFKNWTPQCDCLRPAGYGPRAHKPAPPRARHGSPPYRLEGSNGWTTLYPRGGRLQHI